MPLAVKFALAVRNQADRVIGNYLGESANHRTNGEELIVRHFAPLCTTFSDVGANEGSWTQLWLENSASEPRGALFEPLPALFARLAERFSTQNKLLLVNAAAGDAPGTMPFFVDETFSETSSLVGVARNHDSKRIEVSVCTLDERLTQLGFTEVNFVKIDAEGFDGRVLRGAQSMLATGSIKVLQFEYNSTWMAAGSTLTETLAYLEGFGYEVFLIRSDGLHRFNMAKWGEFFSFSNFLAIHKRAHFPIHNLLRASLI
jgi:FkbM family methyltransferase